MVIAVEEVDVEKDPLKHVSLHWMSLSLKTNLLQTL